MKIYVTNQKSNRNASALALTLIMCAIALAILASVMAWASSSARLTHRSIQYTRSIAAAEAATEKVLSQISRDFLYGGENQVVNNLNLYRQSTVPTTADSPYWASWQFNDAEGHLGQTYVQRTNANSYIVLDGTYANLKGYGSTYTVVAHARDTASMQDVTAGVLQELQLAGIPIFQFAMYSSGNMEISCGQPLDVTGRVHANKTLYVEPDNALTFESGVTAVTDILFQRDPLDPRGPVPNGGVVYVHPDQKITPVQAMILPIGTTNTPEAIREIIEPPRAGENMNSPIGRLRYYNQSDLLVIVSDTGISGSSGGAVDGFQTVITNTDLQKFVSTASTFKDDREEKTVQPIDIDIASLKTWSETNRTLRPLLGGTSLRSVYVDDRRSPVGGFLGAVRVVNGQNLPTNGLTVATGDPLYVKGHYNQTNDANLGTADTSTTRPASLVADAITILSQGWTDTNSFNGLGSRIATATTVNAAFLTGVVETTADHYSGGMENFPRFLETWGATKITYNGSMVKMFPSLHATGYWGKPNVYVPPARNWAFDTNFEDPLKLPPLTPSLLQVFRKRWVTADPDSNVASANHSQ